MMLKFRKISWVSTYRGMAYVLQRTLRQFSALQHWLFHTKGYHPLLPE